MPIVRPRSCVECKHWYFDGGSPTYSELTIGDEWSSTCGKKHWTISYRDRYLDGKSYAKLLLTARTCTDFEYADYAEPLT